MSSELMISQPPSSLSMRPEDSYGVTALGPMMQQQAQPLKRIHQSLRGRYLLAFTLASLGAVIGAAAGYLSQKPLYQSDGVIEIKPYVWVAPDKQDQMMTGHAQFIARQIALLREQRLLQAAIADPDWVATRNTNGRGDSIDLVAFNKALGVKHQPGSGLIWVSFADPDAEIATAAVKALIGAYMRTYGDPDVLKHTTTKKFYEDRKRLDQTFLKNAENNRITALQDYKMADLSMYHSAKIQELIRQEQAHAEAQRVYQAALAASQQQDGKEKTELSVAQIAEVDPAMKEHLRKKQELEMNLLRLTKGHGLKENHRSVQLAKGEIEMMDTLINEYAQTFRKSYTGVQVMQDGATSFALTPEALDQLRRQEEQARVALQKAQEEANKVGTKQLEIDRIDNEIKNLIASIAEADYHIERLNTEAHFTSGRIEVLSWGNVPGEPVTDKRKQFAALGLMGGGAIPFMLFLAIGLMDHRYRYSDEAGGPDMSGVNLLGILPNLPDRLSDPEQASVAAHCVHQIRTMLQVNPNGMDRNIFAITSASPGDGKTSLSLALGLSFAACGSRTLLIDCDLVGAGLTARLNIDAPEGVLEAIASGSLMEYIRPTDIADLAILPVGAAQAHHASTLSPSALRRLMQEARKHYEIILIDTGPILGSIEASLVAAVADGVILAVARGQQRPLVERAISHLATIGAPLAGVVFNRAQAQDFETSINRRSVKVAPGPANPMENATRFGPVARAVASSSALKSDDENQG